MKINPPSVIFVRHGETKLNANNIVRGWSNAPIDKEGLEEAEEAAKEFADAKIDCIYYSPLKRAEQTAKLIQKHHDTEVDAIPEDALKTWNIGEFQGEKKTEEIKEVLREFEKQSSVKVPGGESYDNFKERVKEFTDKMFKEAKQDNVNLLLVTHNKVFKYILDDPETEPGECEIFHWNGKKWKQQ